MKKKYKIQLPKGKKVTMTNVDFENGVMTINVELENERPFGRITTEKSKKAAKKRINEYDTQIDKILKMADDKDVRAVANMILQEYEENICRQKQHECPRTLSKPKIIDEIDESIKKHSPELLDTFPIVSFRDLLSKQEDLILPNVPPKDGDFITLRWKTNATFFPDLDGEYYTIEREAIGVFKEIKKCDNINYLFCHIAYFLDEGLDNRPVFIYGQKGCKEYAMGKVSMFDEIKPATKEEKKFLIDKLAEIGKRWNEKEKRIEDIEYIPKDGDFVYICAGYEHIVIFKNIKGNDFNVYAECNNFTTNFVCASLAMPLCRTKDIREIRPATEEEKKLLIDKLAERNKKWNAETKQIEDVRWRAKEGEPFYVVTFNAGVDSIKDGHNGLYDLCYNIGNYFKTKEAAEKAAKQIREIFKNSPPPE